MMTRKEAFCHSCEHVKKNQKQILREKFWHAVGVLLATLGIIAFLIAQILLVIL